MNLKLSVTLFINLTISDIDKMGKFYSLIYILWMANDCLWVEFSNISNNSKFKHSVVFFLLFLSLFKHEIGILSIIVWHHHNTCLWPMRHYKYKIHLLASHLSKCLFYLRLQCGDLDHKKKKILIFSYCFTSITPYLIRHYLPMVLSNVIYYTRFFS